MAAAVLNIDVSKPYGAYIAQVREAALALRAGGVAVFPTDTVYALGADSGNPAALARIAAIKRRDPRKPLALLLHNAAEATRHVADFPPVARRAAAAFWPGPLTLVLPDRAGGTIGLRVPAGRIASDLAREIGRPLAATSANRSGEEPLGGPEILLAEFGNDVDLFIFGDRTPSGAVSTVARPTGLRLEILRAGAVSRAQLDALAGLRALFVCTGNSCRSPMAEALARTHAAALLGCAESALSAMGLHFSSAGTAALPGAGAHVNAQAALHEMGTSLASHRSKAVMPSEIEQADRTYVMARAHLELLNRWVPEAKGRTCLLSVSGEDIPDPIGEPLGNYRTCARRIDDALRAIVPGLVEEWKRGMTQAGDRTGSAAAQEV